MLVYHRYLLDCIRKAYARKKRIEKNQQHHQRRHRRRHHIHCRRRWLMQISDVIKASGCSMEMALQCEAVELRRSYTLQSFFRKAVCQNDVTTVKGLIMHQRDEIDLDAWNNDGICPIHQCCIDGNKKLMSVLLRAGANVNAADPKGWTSLHTSAAIGNYDLTKYLLRNGANIMALTTNNELPIDLSFNVSIGILLGNAMKSQGFFAEAELYLSKINESLQKEQQSRFAMEQKEYYVEKALCPVRKETSRNVKPRKDSLAINQPSRRNSKPRTRKISRQYAVNHSSSNVSPTSILKKCDSYDSSSSSSSQDVPLRYSRTSSTGSTTLSYSSSSSSSDEGESYDSDTSRYPTLKRQLSVQFDSEVLFMNYVQENEHTKLSALLEELHDLSMIDKLDRKGLSATHWAAIKGFPDCINVLERYGGDINVTDPFGWTPLHAAVVTNNTACVEKLLELNADIYALTKDGESVFDWPIEESTLNILRDFIREHIDGSEIRCTDI